jgi:hypothetical protein
MGRELVERERIGISGYSGPDRPRVGGVMGDCGQQRAPRPIGLTDVGDRLPARWGGWFGTDDRITCQLIPSGSDGFCRKPVGAEVGCPQSFAPVVVLRRASSNTQRF